MKLAALLKWNLNQETSADADAEVVEPRGASREPLREKAESTSEQTNSETQDWWWQPFYTFCALVVFVTMLWSVTSNLWQWLNQPVSSIALHGQVQHLDREALGQRMLQMLDKPLLDVDIAEVQQLVRDEPWVRVAAIKRRWPARLDVMLEEEVPVARWGERGLLNHQGDIFWPALKEEYRSLPRLSGPAPDTERVMSQFHDLNQILRPAGLSVVSLDLEARGAWTMELSNELKVVIGREAMHERLQRFLDLYRLQLKDRVTEIEQIDIRYTNGVAVKWRETPEEKSAG